MVIIIKWQKFLEVMSFVGNEICGCHITRNFIIILKFTELEKLRTPRKIPALNTYLHAWNPMLLILTKKIGDCVSLILGKYRLKYIR